MELDLGKVSDNKDWTSIQVLSLYSTDELMVDISALLVLQYHRIYSNLVLRMGTEVCSNGQHMDYHISRIDIQVDNYQWKQHFQAYKCH